MRSVHYRSYGENEGEELFKKNGVQVIFTGEIWAENPYYESGDDEPNHTRYTCYDSITFYGKLTGSDFNGTLDQDELEKILTTESFEKLKSWAEAQEPNIPRD